MVEWPNINTLTDVENLYLEEGETMIEAKFDDQFREGPLNIEYSMGDMIQKAVGDKLLKNAKHYVEQKVAVDIADAMRMMAEKPEYAADFAKYLGRPLITN